MTGAADSFATLTFTYNSDGELQTDATSGPGTHQPSVTLTYSYDELGDEISVSDSLSSQGIRRKLVSVHFSRPRRRKLVTTEIGVSSFFPTGRKLVSATEIGVRRKLVSVHFSRPKLATATELRPNWCQFIFPGPRPDRTEIGP
jgi:hypothetical protein